MATDLSPGHAGEAPADGFWSAEDTSPQEVAEALSRLLDQRDQGSDRAVAPGRALNLVAVVPGRRRGEVAERLEAIGRSQPCRTVVCGVDEGRRSMDAWATITCEVPDHPGALTICRETVALELGPAHLPLLESILDPLLVNDVVTVLWAPAHPEAVDSLCAETDFLIFDSVEERDPRTALRRASDLAGQLEVVDLAWLRTVPWRERLAGAFHHPDSVPGLWEIESVEVRYHADAMASGLLLVGWMASRLGWEPSRPLTQTRERTLEARARAADGEVRLRLKHDPEPGSPALGGITVTTRRGATLSLDRAPGGLRVTRYSESAKRSSWVAFGASRGELGLLPDAVRHRLSHDPAYRPAVAAATAMLE